MEGNEPFRSGTGIEGRYDENPPPNSADRFLGVCGCG